MKDGKKTNFTLHFPRRLFLSQFTNNISIRQFFQLTRREQLKSSTATKDYPSRFNIQLSQDGTRAVLKIAQQKTENSVTPYYNSKRVRKSQVDII